jgi:hypothetical protein
MTNKKAGPDDLTKRMVTEDDVEGHGNIKKSAPDGVAVPKATEDDDVEGHGNVKRSAPDGNTTKKKAVEDDDVEGHGNIKKSAPDGNTTKKKAVEDDDVEGHMIGTMNPVMARELARAKEQDVQRAVSRGNLISDVKRAVRRKD